jgi:tetratricopeptide (TPR) repeat protein
LLNEYEQGKKTLLRKRLEHRETVARVGRLASELGRAVLSALAVAGVAIQERALEANIRKSQRRFPAALKRIGEALAADRGDLRGKLLLQKAQLLGALGEIEASTDVLREAIPHIDEAQEPRTALGVRFQFLVCLCLQGRAVEAVSGLAAVRGLVEQLDQAMDAVRLEWLEGKIAAGTGRAEEAEEAFEQVRRKFASHEPPLAFNHSLVGSPRRPPGVLRGRQAREEAEVL